jgi:hypothetical protein
MGTVDKPPKTAEAAASVSVTGKKYFWRGFVSDCRSVAALGGEMGNFAMSRTANPQEEIAALIT